MMEASMTLDVFVADADRLFELARVADDETLGTHAETYTIADAFALAFNNANLVAEAMACLKGWSCVPVGGFKGEAPA